MRKSYVAQVNMSNDKAVSFIPLENSTNQDSTIPMYQIEEHNIKFPNKPIISNDEHQLNETYCIWSRIIDSNKKTETSGSFSSSLSIIGCFNTVESFWKYYLHLNRRPSYKNYDISFFKYGIKPMWEDKECENGGTLLFTCINRQSMDRYFETLLLAMIGEQFFPINIVVGVVYRYRSSHNVTSAQLWFRNFEQQTADYLSNACKRLPGWNHHIRCRILPHKEKVTHYPPAEDSTINTTYVSTVDNTVDM